MVEFFDKLVHEYKLVPSRSEALRQCVNIAMPYIANMVNFMKHPLTDEEINNIREYQNKLAEKKAKQLLLEQKDPTKRKQNMDQDILRKHKDPQPPLDNMYWNKMFKDGDWINVPKEPDLEEIPQVYMDGIGYVPINRIEDFKNNNKGGVKP